MNIPREIADRITSANDAGTTATEAVVNLRRLADALEAKA